jgi:Domain of unknown function (DUF4382)
MNATAATFRNALCFLSMLALSAVLAACSGGGGEGTTANPSGTASVRVSLAAVPQDLAAAPQAGIATPGPSAKPMPPDGIDHVWITIHRIALLPGPDGSGPDPSGEPSVLDNGSPDSGFVSGEVSPPEEVDLLNLPPGTAARFLNAIDNVPAGTYGKIRLFYHDPKVHFIGAADNTATHPTANYHLDIHFKGGDLFIPVATDGADGVIVRDVTVYFEPGKDGLKITVNPNNILMRPQVFATVGAVEYGISGIADNVDKMPGTFDVSTSGGRSFHIMFSSDNNVTNWAFQDNETKQQVSIDNNLLGIAALRDGSLVDVYGMFTAVDTLFADKVMISFTDAIPGPVAPGDAPPSGWQFEDPLEFFELRFADDNVVIPMPSRTEARYDNNANLSQTFSDNIIVDNTCVRARGYFDVGGIEAFWISWRPFSDCP